MGKVVSINDFSNAGQRRYMMAVAHAWGREDGGDQRLQEMAVKVWPSEPPLVGMTHLVLLFANYAATQTDLFVAGQIPVLDSVHKQYEEFVNGAQWILSLVAG